MKKLFAKIGIVLMTSVTVMPLVACTFNFYVNRATNSIAKSFADQTSALIKSMVMSKVLKADTNSTNDDIMKKTVNSSINNLSSGVNLQNWGDLQSKWGVNGNIDFNGFDPNDFFVASGKGELTKNVNNKRNINEILNSISGIRILTSLTNPILSEIVLDKGFDAIRTFLESLQGDLSDSPAGLQLVANLINHYGSDFVTPITRLFGNLVDGKWSDTQTKTPTNENELTTFMKGWKDVNNQPYSAWSNGSSWSISPTLFPGHEVKDWVPTKDYDLYRGGTLINYLFWKISKDNNLNKVGETTSKPRYLGDILSDYITISGSITNPKVDFNDSGFSDDIIRYLPYIMTNPLYPLLIVEGIVPIIKKWILNMSDITQGVKHLTVGNGYPTDPSTNSYNLLDIVNTIKSLISNPDQLRKILENVLGKNSSATKEFDTFMYDVKLSLQYIIHIKLTLGGIIGDGAFDPKDLLDKIIKFIVNSDSVKNTIDTVTNLITEISQQYPGSQGINFDLQKLEEFLFNNTKGLLIILNATITQLKKMIRTVHEIQLSDVKELYKALGGRLSDDPDFGEFIPNLPIAILQNAMLETDSELTKILNLVFGDKGQDPNKLGIANIIINNNTKWIKDNYEDYFDASSTGTNKKIAKTYNITMIRNTTNNIETINLKYDFRYTINGGKPFEFKINVIDIEDLTTFQGVRNFKFKSIEEKS